MLSDSADSADSAALVILSPLGHGAECLRASATTSAIVKAAPLITRIRVSANALGP